VAAGAAPHPDDVAGAAGGPGTGGGAAVHAAAAGGGAGTAGGAGVAGAWTGGWVIDDAEDASGVPVGGTPA
jgi:hypothetical protein